MSPARRLGFVCWIAACGAWAAPASAQIRVMQLGDSITQGGQEHVSYRYTLWFELQAAGHVVDFVGQRDFINGGGAPNPAWYPDYFTTFDRDHEGYWGWRTDEIVGIIVGAAMLAQPDVVLVHLGTNDIGQMGAAGVTNADTNLRLIIDGLRSVVPQVTVLLGQVIPIGPGTSYFDNADQVLPLNAVIADVAADLDTTESPVVLVDQHTGFDLGTMMQTDGLHPNVAGEDQMAQVWATCLDDVLPGVNPPPTVELTAPVDGGAFTAPADIALAADASDASGVVDEVTFYANSVAVGTDTTAPFTVTWMDAAVGSYALTAVATDDEGASSTSAAAWIAVLPAGDTVVIAITNGSFEDPPLADGTLAEGPGTIGEWLFSGTASTFVGIFNPPAGSYPGAGGDASPAGADGANVAYLFNNGGPAEAVSTFQQLPEVLAAEGEYALRVAIGRFLPDQPYVFSEYGGYRIELLAGATVIAAGADAILPAVGEFRDAIVSVAAADVDPALFGEPLAVRLTLPTDQAPRSTHFDDVRLTRYEAPGPEIPALSAWGLAALALVLLAAGAVLAGRTVKSA